jgi:hypothetical protein
MPHSLDGDFSDMNRQKWTCLDLWIIVACFGLMAAVFTPGCGKRQRSEPVAGNNGLTSWERPRFQPGGSNAMVFYVIYGSFPTNIQLSASTYRSSGLPKGVQLRKLNRDQRLVLPFTDGDFAKTAGRDNPAAFAKILESPGCVVIQGEVADSADLNYLRDSIGIATWFLDHGGVAVMDPQQLKLYDAASWRKDIFDQVPPRLSLHVVILVSEEPDGTRWFHTRGLRKFGRPDLSFHNVPPAQEQAVTDLFKRFIILQAEGGRIPDGQEVRMTSLPPGLRCHQEGAFDDLDFNNIHVEVRRGQAENHTAR